MGWLDSLRQRWREKRIRRIIAARCAANEQLRAVLVHHKIELGRTRAIDLHFWAPGPVEAKAVAGALEQRGFPTKKCGPCAEDRPAGLWNVEALAEVAPSLALSEGFTEEMVRLAMSLGTVYDGWGTALGQDGDEQATQAP